jgi:hypothetical protein
MWPRYKWIANVRVRVIVYYNNDFQELNKLHIGQALQFAYIKM